MEALLAATPPLPDSTDTYLPFGASRAMPLSWNTCLKVPGVPFIRVLTDNLPSVPLTMPSAWPSYSIVIFPLVSGRPILLRIDPESLALCLSQTRASSNLPANEKPDCDRSTCRQMKNQTATDQPAPTFPSHRHYKGLNE